MSRSQIGPGPRLRSTLTVVSRHRAASALVGMVERISRHAPDLLAVLTYHRVAPRSATRFDPGLISATPDELDEQVRFLSSRFDVLALHEVLERRRLTGPMPRPSVLLTFDDAYADFLEHAWPVLDARGVPVTLFVATGYPDAPASVFPWERLYQAITRSDRVEVVDALPPRHPDADRFTKYREVSRAIGELPWEASLAAVDRLVAELGAPPAENPVLGWSDLTMLAGKGVELAAHTQWHARLDRASVELVDQEIRASLDELKRRIGHALPVLAYPAGHHDAIVVEQARAAGVEVAFTTRRGLNNLRRCDWLRMRRINVGPRSSLALIRAQLVPAMRRLFES